MKTFGCLALIGLAAAFSGCGSATTPSPDRFYDFKGKVVSVAEDRSTTVDHEDIPGFMQAMRMVFPVEDSKLLEGIAAGDEVEGRLKANALRMPSPCLKASLTT